MTHGKDFAVSPTWRLVLKDLGVQPADVMRRAGLPENLFDKPNARVSTEGYFRFWVSLEAELDDPLFPIHMVQGATAESFSPPVFAILCSPNLKVALRRLSKYKRLIAPVALHVRETPSHFACEFEWLDASMSPPASLCAMELAFIVHFIRMATREHIQPLEVTSPTPPRPAAAYREFLGVDVQHGARISLTFANADAEQPFLTANAAMWTAFEPELRKRLAELDQSATVSERVRAALLEALPSGQSSAVLIAGRLAMSKRTLQRRLSDEGTTYQELLSSTREALARHYLSETSLSCKEISFLLGYEEPNSFFRAFHEWTGDTPEHLRQQLQN